jgi:Tol biopolymer transport system component
MKYLNYLLTIGIFILTLTSCTTDGAEMPEPNKGSETPADTVFDNSLIVASIYPEGNATKLIFINPVNGKEVFNTSPDLEGIKKFATGYMSNRLLLTSLSGSDITINSLFSCDAKTGTPVVALTDEKDLNVLDIAGSSAGTTIAFTAKPATIPEYYQLFTMNIDGSNLAHASQPLEHVSGLHGGSYELLNIESPAFSPDGKILAFNAHVDNIDSIPNSKFFDGVMIISDDKCKKMLYWEQGKDRGIENVCWSYDGKFIIFIINDKNNNFKRLVKAVNIESLNVTDLTSSLEIDGIEIWHLSASPNSNKIVFTQHLSSGSDLFVAEYETNGNSINITKSPVKITDKESDGHNYYMPYWQNWDENTNKH